MKEPSYDFPPPFRVIPPEIVDLLGEPGQVFDGMEEDCLGCGIENLPTQLIRILRGENFGIPMVRVS